MATSSRQLRLNGKTKSVKNGGTIENPDTTMSAESEHCSTPTSKDMWELVRSAEKLLSQTNELENHHPTGDCNVMMTNSIGKTQEQSEIHPNKKGERLTRSHSLNLTEIAKMAHSDCSDEVGSAFNPAPVSVDGYTVKPEMATTLKAIFLKQGDIAKGSSLRSVKSRSSLLEMVCDIIQKLQETGINRITPAELQSMVDVVIDLESMGLKLDWLHKRLDEISEAVKSINGSSSLKEAKKSSTAAIGRKERDLESYYEEMLVLQNKICLAQDEVDAVKAEDEKINILISDTKAKVKIFYQRALADGLL